MNLESVMLAKYFRGQQSELTRPRFYGQILTPIFTTYTVPFKKYIQAGLNYPLDCISSVCLVMEVLLKLL